MPEATGARASLQQIVEKLPDEVVSLLYADAQGYFLTHVFPRPLLEAIAWSDEEKRVLTNNGAVIYLPTGETIRGQIGQKQPKRPFWHVAPGYEIDGRNRLTDFPARPIEVAIFPNPEDTEEFFVPGSFGRTISQLVNEYLPEDGDRLRRRLGLENFALILPEASEATEVAFRYFDDTGRRLLGRDYRHRLIRTSTPTNKVGSCFAGVGYWDDVRGIRVGDGSASEGHPHLGAARWGVPTGAKKLGF